jgi:PAS domain S-box-containing protein
MDGTYPNQMDSSKHSDLEKLDDIARLRKQIEYLENQIRQLSPTAFGNPDELDSARNREQNSLIKSVVQSSTVPAFLVAEDNRFLFTNPAFLKTFQIAENGIENQTLDRVFPHEVCRRIDRSRAELLNGEISSPFEWELSFPGDLKIFSFSLFPVFDEDKVCFAIGGIVTDITDQSLSERRLVESEERFRTLVEKTDNLVIQLDPIYQIQFANQAALRLLGMSENHCIGLNMLDFVHVEDSDRLDRSFSECISAGKHHLTQENRLPQNDGGVRYLLWSYQFIYNEYGGLVCINGIAQDITQRRSLEMQMMKAKENAEAADRSKSEFLAMISHEIRTPLNSIIGLSDLLHQSDLCDEERMMLETISSSGQSLLNLINDVLDLSKVEAGHITLNKEEINLRDCLTQINNLFLFRAKTKGIEFIWEISENVPRTILSDRERFIQVLNNLVGNAIKFTTEGYVRVRVKAEVLTNVEELDLWSDDEGEHLRPYRLIFEVEDTGIGIKQEQRVLLFQPFSQADPSIRRRFGGTGLGLVVSRKLAKLMNGDIDLTSKYGQGSVFTFSMQVDGRYIESRIHSEREHASNMRNDRCVDPLLATRHPMRIMVVDDISHNRLVMNMLLKRMGYNPIILSSGHEALEYLSESGVDLIFMDMVMPEQSGMEISQEIRARQASGEIRNRSIRIIALTANAMDQDREECLEAGMDDFVTKPIRFSAIQTCIVETTAFLKNHSSDEIEFGVFEC